MITPGKAGGLSNLPSRLPLIIMGLAIGLSVAAETASLFWSAKLLNDQAPELAAIAGLGAAFYGACNAIVRFRGDRLRARYGEIPLLLASLALATAGFIVLGLSHSFTLNVIAFAGVGFGLAILCPCLFNLAASPGAGKPRRRVEFRLPHRRSAPHTGPHGFSAGWPPANLPALPLASAPC